MGGHRVLGDDTGARQPPEDSPTVGRARATKLSDCHSPEPRSACRSGASAELLGNGDGLRVAPMEAGAGKRRYQFFRVGVTTRIHEAAPTSGESR